MSEVELTLTPQEAAAILKCSKNTIYAMCDRNELKWIPVGEGRKRLSRRILKSSVLDYIQRESNAVIRMPSDGPLNDSGFTLLNAFLGKGG